jgi:putative SOS response-associated peptidase YedK
MCGRYTLFAPAKRLEALFGLEILGELPPRYNIAPGGAVLAVRPGKSAVREPALFQWGLIPSWSKDPTIGARMINARAETAAAKPAFRAAMKRRRCLIPASGFYEWAKSGPAKQPFYIRMKDDKPFAFAGLWEQWCGEDGGEIDSCAILTTDANDLLKPIHHRMPVIVAPGDFDRWLDPANEKPATLADLLRPYSSDEMTAHPVDRRVGNPRNDDPGLIEGEEELGEQRDLFG